MLYLCNKLYLQFYQLEKDDIIEDITEESEVEETDVDTSFHFSQEDTITE